MPLAETQRQAEEWEGFLGGAVMNTSAKARDTEMWVQSLGREDAPEEEMATSILAWRIPRTEEPGGLEYLGLYRVGHKRAAQREREGSPVEKRRCCRNWRLLTRKLKESQPEVAACAPGWGANEASSAWS